jgi:hypothetical protein
MEFTAKLPEGILREAITPQKKKDQYSEIKKQKHICKGLKFMLDDDLYFEQGFIYRKAADNTVIAFVLFNVGEIEDTNDYNNEDIDEETMVLNGVLLCSGQKGIGKIIQSDLEDYAKFHKHPYIRIDVASPKLYEYYYKLGYEKIEGYSDKVLKKVNLSAKKGGKRKTRKSKKVKNQTRKHK